MSPELKEKVYKELQNILEIVLFWYRFFKKFSPIIFAILFFTIVVNAFDFYKVGGVSMEPNFVDGDIVILNKLTPKFEMLERGDVVGVINVREKRNEHKKLILKRVLGMPNEKISIVNKKVYIEDTHTNTYIINEDYQAVMDNTLKLGTTTILGKEDYYVMGDNRDQSEDSRVWGTVQSHEMLGKVIFKFNMN